MLSRVANSLFWLARYLERADRSARLLTVTHGYAQDVRAFSHAAAEDCWAVARGLLGGPAPWEASPAETLRRLVFDDQLPGSLLSAVSAARENARGIRDAIPSEMWEELNILHLRLREEASSPPPESVLLALLTRIRSASLGVLALRDHAMTRADEWHFLRLGQYTEASDLGARTLAAMYSHAALGRTAREGHNIEVLHLAATLRCCNALEAFSRAEHTATAAAVAEFLLLDARFPGSIEFAVQEIGRSLHALSGTPHDVFSSEAEQLCGRLIAELRFAAIEEILADGFDNYLHRLLDKLGQLSSAICDLYFR